MADFTLYIGRSAVIPFEVKSLIDEGATFSFTAKRSLGAAAPDISSTSITYDSATQRGEVALLNADTTGLGVGILQCEIQAEYAVGENYVLVRGEAEVKLPVDS